jgi:hypothetical protein
VVPELKPDITEIERHLAHITRRWGELGVPCSLELVFLSADDKAEVKNVARFTPNAAGIREAAEHAAAMNRHGINAYAVVNPVDASRPLRAGKRTERADILAAFYHWADGDSADAAANIRNFVGPPFTFYVLTGTQPCRRPHVYWELEEPSRNLAAWEVTQRNIAATLGTDRAVVDPPRIMRLAGTINWPKPSKRNKGYIAELTTIGIYGEDERPPISSERMARAFAGRPQQEAAPGGEHWHIDTGDQRRNAEDYAEILRRARTDGEKHGGVRDLAASLAGMGMARALAEAIIRDACPIWDANVESLIESAYAKFYKPKEAPEPKAEDAAPFDMTPVSAGELRKVQPRRWLYGYKLIRGFVSVMASPGGTGKSALVSAMGLDMAAGVTTLHDTPHRALKVWLYNLEDPRDETIRKVAAVMQHKRLSTDTLDNLIVTSGRDRSLIIAQEIERGIVAATPDVPACIDAIRAAGVDVLTVDPVIRSHRVNENDNKALDFVMDLYARIASEADCSVLLVHHTRKGFIGGDADSIRGASSMSSAARIAVTLQTMQAEEAKALNVPEAERRRYVRIDNAKANLSPPADKAEWIKLESQSLGNGDEEYPNGDSVQVAVKWEPPSPFDGIGERILEVFRRIDRGFVHEDGTPEPWSPDKRSGDRWVANAILASFPDGDKSEAQCFSIFKKWRDDGLVEEYKYQTQRNRTEKTGVRVANWPEGAE